MADLQSLAQAQALQMQVLVQQQEILRQHNLKVVNDQMEAANQQAMDMQQGQLMNQNPPNDPGLSVALDDAKEQVAARENNPMPSPGA